MEPCFRKINLAETYGLGQSRNKLKTDECVADRIAQSKAIRTPVKHGGLGMLVICTPS